MRTIRIFRNTRNDVGATCVVTCICLSSKLCHVRRGACCPAISAVDERLSQ